MRYHGNYCGPNWSDGKQQESVVGSTEPVDVFDKTCQDHDSAYALGHNKETADYQFFRTNIFAGPKESVAAVLVGTQGVVRTIDRLLYNQLSPYFPFPKMPKSKTNNMPKLRSKATIGQTSAKSKKSIIPMSNVSLSTVPAAYGFSLRMKQPIIKRTANTASIVGADYAGTVFGTIGSEYSPAASVLLNPIYFNSGMLGSLARTFEKFRFVRAVVQYVPSVPTSTQGQVIMTSTRTVKEPFIASSSSTFLSRALSQGNAVAMPVWKDESITIECGTEWSVVDALLDGDLDDCIQEEVQVYATCEATLTTGILILHYEVEFKDPLFTFHSGLVPCPVSNGTLVTFTDDGAINAISDSFRIAGVTTNMALLGNGAVFRLVFVLGRSALPTGVATWPALLQTGISTAATTTTTTTTVANFAISSGYTIYAQLETSSRVTCYASYDGAVHGSRNECLYYQTATTAVGSYTFHVQAVRLGAQLRMTTQ
mgnify:FL=1